MELTFRKNIIFAISLLLITPIIFCEPPQVEITNFPPLEYLKSGNYIISFRFKDSDNPENITATIKYINSYDQNEKDIVTDLNLRLGNCGNDLNFSNFTNCSYNWDISKVGDGNYRIEVIIKDLNNSDSNSATSSYFIIDKTEPSKINDLNAQTGNSAGEIIISWTTPNLDDLNNFEIRHSKSTINESNFGNATLVTGVPNPIKETQQTMTISGLSPCETYYVAIKVVDKAGNKSEISNVVSTNAGREDNAPTIPQNFSATSTSGYIRLTWTANNEGDFNRYVIYRTTNNNWDSNILITIIYNINTTSYSDTNINYGTTYYYKIAAIDKCGNLSLSNSKNATAQQPITPAKPNIRSSHGEDEWSKNKDPWFAWNEIENADGYSCVLDSNSGTIPDNTIDNVCDKNVSYTNKPDGIYYFHVKACTNEGICGQTDHYKIKIDTEKPTKPTNFTVQVDGNKRKLSWSESDDEGSGVEKYFIYRGTSCNNATKIKEISSENTSYNDNYVPPEDKNFCYKVTAIDAAGNESDAAIKDKIFVKGSNENKPTDNEKPTIKIEFPTENNELTGNIKVMIKAEDNNEIKKVLCYITDGNNKCMSNEEKCFKKTINATFDSNIKKYFCDLNTQEFDNGEVRIYITAEDKSGNKNNAEVKIKIKNNVIKIKEEIEQKYDLEKIEEKLRVVIPKEEKVEEVKALTEKCNIKRRILLKEDENKNKQIEISIEGINDSNELKDFKIIEIIPKEVAKNSSLIESIYEYQVIEDDPIVAFFVYDVEPNKQFRVNYAIKDFNEKILDNINETMAKYNLPPLVLEGETDIAEIITPQQNNNQTQQQVKQEYPALIIIVTTLAIILAGFLVYKNFFAKEKINYYYKEPLGEKMKRIIKNKKVK